MFLIFYGKIEKKISINKEDFLQDETGNRRFLIIEAGENEPRKNLFESESINDFKAAERTQVLNTPL